LAEEVSAALDCKVTLVNLAKCLDKAGVTVQAKRKQSITELQEKLEYVENLMIDIIEVTIFPDSSADSFLNDDGVPERVKLAIRESINERVKIR
jgi:hypothetical protein